MRAAINSDGNFSIDLAELFRAYPQKDEDVAPERSEEHLQGHGETVSDYDTMELRVRNAQLEDKLRALRLLRWPWRRSG